MEESETPDERTWRVAGRRLRFAEKKALTWGLPILTGLVSSGVAYACGLGPFGGILGIVGAGVAAPVIKSALSSFGGRLVGHGAAHVQDVIAERDFDAIVDNILYARDRALERDEPCEKILIHGTDTALDGTEYPMPITVLRSIGAELYEQAYEQAKENLHLHERRELDQAHFILKHHSGKVGEHHHHGRRCEVMTDAMAQATINHFRKDVVATLRPMIEERVIEVARCEGRRKSIEREAAGFGSPDTWRPQPEWMVHAGIDRMVKPALAPVTLPGGGEGGQAPRRPGQGGHEPSVGREIA